MVEKNIDTTVSFYDLKWDSEFFGVRCAKAILHRPLSKKDWNELKERFNDYQFISIENRDSEPINTQIIGKETSAFLADVNIQFKKKVERSCMVPEKINIHRSMERNEKIIPIANFQFSKFTEDPELAKRRGEEVYRQWIINSFNNSEKIFAISKDSQDEINGFLLYSYSNNVCVVELIAVANSDTKRGIGSQLFKAVEYDAKQNGYDEIGVGTQVRNKGAINFYHKVGCKQVGCHQVFHYWNL